MDNTLPWVEKYRPNNFEDIISHVDVLNTLNNLIKNNKMQHMIFYGPPGTGKTTTILACAKKLYGAHYNNMILELNGSDDRGINVVRDQIKKFSATDSRINNLLSEINITKMKLVILDEADAMTYDAQFALRRVIEIYTSSTRFCLICNYLTKIIPALHSRCQIFRFQLIDEESNLNKLKIVIKEENINIRENVLKKIIEYSEGDMRKSLNVMQTLKMLYNEDEITLEKFNKTVYNLSDNDIKMLISYTSNSIIDMYNNFTKLKKETHISNIDIVNEIIIYYKKNITKKKTLKIVDLFIELAKIEINLMNNINSDVQLIAICSIIYKFNNNT